MNAKQATAKLAKLLGPKFHLSHNPGAPDAEGRAEARERAARYGEQYRAAVVARDERMRQLLAADREYQRYAADAKAYREQQQKNQAVMHRYRWTVGTVHNMGGLSGRLVEAQADTLAGLVAALEAKRKAKGSVSI